jgi:hypothetical protein
MPILLDPHPERLMPGFVAIGRRILVPDNKKHIDAYHPYPQVGQDHRWSGNNRHFIDLRQPSGVCRPMISAFSQFVSD